MADPWDQFEAVTAAPPTDTSAQDESEAPTAAPEASSFDQFASVEADPATIEQPAEAPNVTVARMIREGATKEQVEQFVASTGADPAAIGNLDEALANRGNVRAQMVPAEDQGFVAAGARGFGDMATFGLLDEAGGVVDALGGTDDRENVWNSDKGFGELVGQNIDTNRTILEGDEANHPVARGVGQLLGGLAIPTGMTGVAFKAGKEALVAGATMREARAIAAAAATKRLAAEGAATGGAYGAGSADGGAGERLLGAGIGAAAGAAGGVAFGKAGEALAPGRAARMAAARAAPVDPGGALATKQFAQAAERQGIDYMAADVPGAIKSRYATGLAGITLGGIPLATAAEKTIASAKAARDRIASGIGLVADETGAGQAAQRGAKAFIRSSEQRASDLYEAIPIAADRQAPLLNTRSALSALTKGMESNPKLSALVAENPRLKSFLNALTPETTPIRKPAPVGAVSAAPGVQVIGTTIEGGKLTWQDLKRFRSIVGEIVGKPSLSDDGSQIAAMRKLYAGLSEDMRATAAAEGPQALRQFTRANQYFRGRQDRIDNVLSEVLGDDLSKGPQPAFEALQRLGKATGGDSVKLGRLIRSLPEDDAGMVRSTILSRLGQVSAGRQDGTGTVFSPRDFATSWNKLSPRAKNILFQGDHRKAIEDVVKVTDGMKASSQFANTSKTGVAVTGLGTFAALSSDPFVGIPAIAMQVGGGYLLGNPRFAQWVASAAKKPNPQAALAHVNKLAAIARAEPAIAADVLNVQQKLAGLFVAGTPTAAAAQPQDAR